MRSHLASEPESAAASLAREQRTRFIVALGRSNRLLLLGRAGAGKTTTLCAGIERMVDSGRTGLLAFNRAVVAELRRQVSHLGNRVLVATVDAERVACYRTAHQGEHLLNDDEQIALVRQVLLQCRGRDPGAPRMAGYYARLLQDRTDMAELLGEDASAYYEELKRAHDRFDAHDVTMYLAGDPERLADHFRRVRGCMKIAADEAHDLNWVENQPSLSDW